MSLFNGSLAQTSRGRHTLPKLPSPDADAIAHSALLLKRILDEIQRNKGQISFVDYMRLALYAPGLGYYSAGATKFGMSGDFVTAPLLSPLFSECLSRQCQEILDCLQGASILEIGAGTGQMAADILISLENNKTPLKHYYILEPGADLRAKQKETIQNLCPQCLPLVSWLDTLPPASSFSGIILANEVLDAMPVNRFYVDEQGIHEISVEAINSQLQLCKSTQQNPELNAFVENLALAPGYLSEVNLQLNAFTHSLSSCLNTGLILLIDYGFSRQEYYHPDRSMGTLMCHYRHYAHQDPFFYPGLQDITAHVDFTTIAESALSAGLHVLGFTTQASFLISCGLTDLFESKIQKNTETDFRTTQAVHTLTSPAEMGELFKVMALGKNIYLPLVGFSLHDKRYLL